MDLLDDSVYDVCFVDAKTLVFPEIRVNNTLADWLLHDRGGVEAVGCEGSSRATLVEEALLVCAMGRHRFGLSEGLEVV